MTELLDVVCEAARDKKGEDLIAIEVAKRTILADQFVIVTGRSRIQTRAIADSIVEAVNALGEPVLRVEGYSEGSWILVDCAQVLVHVFTPEQRAFYNLERLWGTPLEERATGT